MFYGYRLDSTTLNDIQLELAEAKNRIQKIADDIFDRLVGDEAAFLGDCVSLGILTKNPEDDLIKIAESTVITRCRSFSLKRLPGKFNLSLYGYLFPYKKKVYLQVDFYRDEFEEAFSYLEDVSISNLEMQEDASPKRQLWEEILKEEKNPISINLTPTLQLKTPVFPDRLERVETWARHQLTNQLMNQFADGQQIPPHLLMRRFDEAMEEFPKQVDQMRKLRLDLNPIILDFNMDKDHFEALLGKREEKTDEE